MAEQTIAEMSIDELMAALDARRNVARLELTTTRTVTEADRRAERQRVVERQQVALAKRMAEAGFRPVPPTFSPGSGDELLDAEILSSSAEALLGERGQIAQQAAARRKDLTRLEAVDDEHAAEKVWKLQAALDRLAQRGAEVDRVLSAYGLELGPTTAEPARRRRMAS